MIILIYQYFDSTTTVGVFASEDKAKEAVQEFLDAYRAQETNTSGYWDASDDGQVEEYRSRFKFIPAELNQIVDRSVGFVYEWI